METKICPKCKRELPATSEFFGNDKKSKDKLQYQCRKCQKEYRENHKEEIAERHKKYSKTSIGIYAKTKARAKARNIPFKFTKEEFVKWYEQQKQQCVYCDILKELLKPLELGRKDQRNHLTIDRKNNNKGYVIDNICLACDKCNTVKNDIFTFKQMREIAQKYIKPIWQQRLKNKT